MAYIRRHFDKQVPTSKYVYVCGVCVCVCVCVRVCVCVGGGGGEVGGTSLFKCLSRSIRVLQCTPSTAHSCFYATNIHHLEQPSPSIYLLVDCGTPLPPKDAYIDSCSAGTTKGANLSVVCLNQSSYPMATIVCNHEGYWEPNVTELCTSTPCELKCYLRLIN